MEKRLLLAAFLSILVLVLWEALFPARRPSPGPAVGAPKRAPWSAPQVPPHAARPAPAAVAGTQARELPVDRPLYRARFSTRGAVLASFTLSRYTDAKGQPLELVRQTAVGEPRPFSIDFGAAGDLTRRAAEALYAAEQRQVGNRQVLRLHFSDGTFSVEKEFGFEDGYVFELRVAISGTEKPWTLLVGPGLRNPSPAERSGRYAASPDVVTFSAGTLWREATAKLEGPVERDLAAGGYVALEDAYFLEALLPQQGSSRALVFPCDLRASEPAGKPARELAGGLRAAGGGLAARAYFGPKDYAILRGLGLHLEETINFGWFGPIARPLLLLLKWFYGFIHNYGVAILIVTLLLRLAMFPLMQKSFASMKKMQALSPKMQAIRDRYKKARMDPGQRAKMNQEIMALYQAEGVNPMGGCLPLLFQMPVLIAFYYVLDRAIELRHAVFIPGWISDLSAKDPTYILVILMTLSMFAQQVMTPSSADPVQKKVFLLMPLLWGFLFKDMPSGLVLYWLFSNILTIGQQALINRRFAAEAAVKKPARRARTGGIRR